MAKTKTKAVLEQENAELRDLVEQGNRNNAYFMDIERLVLVTQERLDEYESELRERQGNIDDQLSQVQDAMWQLGDLEDTMSRS